MTPAERKAAERARKTERGRVKLELWPYADDVPALKRLDESLRKKREKQGQTKLPPLPNADFLLDSGTCACFYEKTMRTYLQTHLTGEKK